MQGDTLAPYIFAIVIDEREEKLGFKMDRRRSRFHHPVIITDTDLADNIAITTGEIHQAQEMLVSVEIEAAIIELHLKGAMSRSSNRKERSNKV